MSKTKATSKSKVTFESFTKAQLVSMARNSDTDRKPACTDKKVDVIKLLKENKVKLSPKLIKAVS